MSVTTIKMGVVADDITGANDIGIMFAKADYLTHVYPIDESGEYAFAAGSPQPDICILDTNSRLDTPEVAYRKVSDATHRLQAAGCHHYFNKTCSVFRGNIGAEFDAMLDTLGEPFAVVVLGFPKNGRLTRNGIHYVHGQKLADSEFRHDPIHPMTQSSLVDILQAQTERRVGLLTHEVVGQGAMALRQQIEAMRTRCDYLILDVIDQPALTTIAHAVHDLPVICGSSALAEALPMVWGAAASPPPIHLPPRRGLGVLCAAGSLMPQTAAQIQHLCAAGVPAFILDTPRLFEPGERQAEIERLIAGVVRVVTEGRDVLLHSPNEPTVVADLQAEGLRRGWSKTGIARLVSDTIAEVVACAVAQAGLNRLVVAGGETSAAVCARLGVTGLRIWQEIQPGLPSCLTLSPSPMLLVLKSGSFGSADFLAQAIIHLKKGQS